jgi:hypothetical protein
VSAAVAKPDLQAQLVELAAKLSRDPLAFVQCCYPWGVAGTELAAETGPDTWQASVLAAVRDGLLNPSEAVRVAVSSGHGPGKSALACWLVHWALCTLPDTRCIITANTANQLSQKTMGEMHKWHRLCLFRDWFEIGAMSLASTAPGHERTWRADSVPWSKENTEAFAGLHNSGRRILVVFDEASAIDDEIWQVTEGIFTDANTQLIWAVFGNPTRNSGRFRECWGKFRHRWRCWTVDSRTAKRTNKQQLQQWIDDYGVDSDYCRIRVRGIFPSAGSMQFIPGGLVDAAAVREADVNIFDALVIGVDVARFGDDASVIYFRKGRDGRTIPPIKLRQVSTMTLAARVADEARRLGADGIFVDGGGVGGGVVDRLRQMQVPRVYDVQFGAKADRAFTGLDMPRSANKRAELWASMREWLSVGAIPDDPELRADLTAVEFGYNVRSEIQLEKKEDLKRRGLASPDVADALALTFAYDIAPSALAGREGGAPARILSDYDPLGAY